MDNSVDQRPQLHLSKAAIYEYSFELSSLFSPSYALNSMAIDPAIAPARIRLDIVGHPLSSLRTGDVPRGTNHPASNWSTGCACRPPDVQADQSIWNFSPIWAVCPSSDVSRQAQFLVMSSKATSPPCHQIVLRSADLLRYASVPEEMFRL